ncbi:ATP-binding protein [Candidatus Woesearchaeota archaeon]|nr:ATP-binding protein [Candidatus Woesearchaeota archaeon]
MILGNIIGKTSTKEFMFLVRGNAKKFDYVQVLSADSYILGQIIEIEKENNQAIAFCNVIGYRKNNEFKRLLIPLEPGIEVLKADSDFIKEIIGLRGNGVYLGKLDGYDDIDVFLDMNKILTNKISILAKTGSGKSYTSGVLIEDMIENGIPLLIIDPHGEYSSLKFENDKDKEKLIKFNVKSKSYRDKINEYSPDIEINPNCKALRLSNYNLSTSDIMQLFPAKLSNTQIGLLYGAVKNLNNKIDFDGLILELDLEDNSAKFSLIHILEYIKKLNIFSDAPTSLQELINPGKCCIINLKGINQELQEVIVYKLLKDLFEARKKNNVAPFFCVIEEAQNFVPERNFGEAKSSGIIRQVAVEGRKFGIGLCIITQRVSRVEKNVLSQCSTNIILKVTNQNDIKSISGSVDGINSEIEKEIKNLPVGTALVTGVLDLPLFVNIRPRRTKHGGESVNAIVNIIKEKESDERDFVKEIKEFKEDKGELLLVIKQKISKKDIGIIEDKKNIRTVLIPCLSVNLKESNVLINLNNGEIIYDVEHGNGKKLFFDINLSSQQKNIFNQALKMREFTASEIFAKSQVNFSEIYDIINILVSKSFFVKIGNKFKVNDAFNVKLEDFALYENPDYFKMEYDEKMEKNFNAVDVVKFIGNFNEVKNYKECWLEMFK